MTPGTIPGGSAPRKAGGVTVHLPLIGAAPGRSLSEPPGEHLYGSEAAAVAATKATGHLGAPRMPKATPMPAMTQ